MIYIGIIVAGVAAFMLGALWYTVLFGEAWKKAIRFTDEAVQAQLAKQNVARTMGTTLVLELVVAALIACLMVRFAITDWSLTLFIGGMLGLFTALSSIKNYLYESRPWQLIAINEGYKFMTSMVMVVILQLFITT